jgi:hypothetical protein
VNDLSERLLVENPAWYSCIIEDQVVSSQGSSTRVGRSWMETVRASADGSRVLEIKVVEGSTVHSQVLVPGANEAPNSRFGDETVVIIDAGVANNHSAFHGSIAIVVNVFDRAELDTGDTAVGDFEVLEDDSTSALGNGSIASHLPTDEVLEDSWDLRVLPVWVCLTLGQVVCVIWGRLAWVGSWDEGVENTQTVLS